MILEILILSGSLYPKHHFGIEVFKINSKELGIGRLWVPTELPGPEDQLRVHY